MNKPLTKKELQDIINMSKFKEELTTKYVNKFAKIGYATVDRITEQYGQIPYLNANLSKILNEVIDLSLAEGRKEVEEELNPKIKVGRIHCELCKNGDKIYGCNNNCDCGCHK